MAEDIKLVEGEYLEYKGRPLVREETTICYGNMTDKCILILEIMTFKDEGGKKLPDTILLQVVDPKNQMDIKRQGTKQGLYEAFELGVSWLEQELAK